MSSIFRSVYNYKFALKKQALLKSANTIDLTLQIMYIVLFCYVTQEPKCLVFFYMVNLQL